MWVYMCIALPLSLGLKGYGKKVSNKMAAILYEI